MYKIPNIPVKNTGADDFLGEQAAVSKIPDGEAERHRQHQNEQSGTDEPNERSEKAVDRFFEQYRRCPYRASVCELTRHV